ncbi:MAG: hypothetical protein Q7K03_10610 [Dehalococcoidia bacterium]|nr:hypothetical protein [Dehalococcoidia bacterium]
MLEYLIVGLIISGCANIALALFYYFERCENKLYREAFALLARVNDDTWLLLEATREAGKEAKP